MNKMSDELNNTFLQCSKAEQQVTKSLNQSHTILYYKRLSVSNSSKIIQA